MDNVNRTLYIPLYGTALVSRRGILLEDAKAEAIWAAEGFSLKGKSRSRWLAYYMAMRARVFDDWVKEKMETDPGAVIIHLGCGLDSRVLRVGTRGHRWFDVDFPEVITERKRFYEETEEYRMTASDIRETGWLDAVPAGNAVVILEGVSMYLTREELLAVLKNIRGHFSEVSLLMDCYTEFAAKASRYKNPINDVGVTKVYGLDDPKLPESSGLAFVKEHSMTPDSFVEELQRMEKAIFRRLYGGKIARKMYRLYEYKRVCCKIQKSFDRIRRGDYQSPTGG